ncbi:MAG: hypothetical protein ACYCZM_05955 [Acidimicrobiales bacterium]
MVNYDSQDYIQTGFANGNLCQTGPVSTPTVWLEYAVAGSTPQYWHNVCFSSYPVSAGQSYDFAVTNLGGYTWGAYIYWNGSWSLLGEFQLSFSTSQQTNIEQNAEFYDTGGYAWPSFDSPPQFSSSLQPAGGGWESWTIPTYPSSPLATVIGEFPSFSTYYDSWSVSPNTPVLSSQLSNPSMTITILGSGSTNFWVASNAPFDSFFDGSIQLSASAVPAGDSVSFSPTSLWLSSNASAYSVMTVTVGALPGSFSFTATACANGAPGEGQVCTSSQETVTITL